MLEKVVTIKNEIGLHARPASLLVKEASRFKADTFLIKKGNKYNCKSIMNVLSMGAKKGDEIILRVDGSDEEEAMEALVDLIENKLNEDE
ncbi:HPr family phosphocarrier protein [Alkaliphilus crotonatoxidans]